jgi:hypothetical protein
VNEFSFAIITTAFLDAGLPNDFPPHDKFIHEKINRFAYIFALEAFSFYMIMTH